MDSTNSESRSRIRGKRKAVIRLLLYALPHLHLFIPALIATAIYTGVTTARAGSVYILLRLAGQFEPVTPESAAEGDTATDAAGSKAGDEDPGSAIGDIKKATENIPKEWKSIVDNDKDFSEGLAKLNRGLDDIDARMKAILRGFVSDGIAHDPVKMNRLATIVTLIFIFLALALVGAATHLAEHLLKQKVLLKIVVSLRVKLLRNLLSQPLAFHSDTERGDLIQRMGGDLGCAVSALNLMLVDLSRQGFAIFWPILATYLIGPWAFIAIVTYFLLLTRSLRKQSRKVHQKARIRQERTSKVTESMVQLFSGIRIVKAFGLERQKIKQYTARNQEFVQTAMGTEVAKAFTRVRIEFVTNLLLVLALIVAGVMIARGGDSLPVDALIFFAAMLVQMWRPIRQFTRTFTEMGDNLAGADRMFEYMDRKPELQDQPGATVLKRINGEVHFDNVSFAYNGGRRVLDQIDLKISPGEVCALVGPSGAGKTTLANLLPRFYDPGTGKVTVDGKDIRTCTQESLREHIAVVTQEPFLFHTSIRENISYGKTGATEEEIVNAAKAAHIHDHIMSLEEGYDTNVGEAGAKLSGGQRQRLTIARAILRNARILILDEATSSLDTESERAIQDALHNLMKGRTTLVIAHRLSTVQHADKICVLQNGVIEDVGTHDELMGHDSLYKRLYEMQFSNGSGSGSQRGSQRNSRAGPGGGTAGT